jgi:hypothetical protein
MVAPAITVSITIAVPAVIMLEASAVSFPIAVIVATAFIARPDPDCSSVWRASPITAMPNVMAPYGIPITVDPNIFGARSDWPYAVYTWRRRSAQFDSDGHLRFQDW